MAFKFLKKRKEEKQELAKIQEIIKEIEAAKEKAKVATNFQLINSDYGETFLSKCAKRSIEEKNSFHIDSAYQILNSWDNYGVCRKNLENG